MSQGGRRTGAGRKCLAPERKKVPVSFSITQETARMIREIRGNGGNVNSVIEEAIARQHKRIFAD